VSFITGVNVSLIQQKLYFSCKKLASVCLLSLISAFMKVFYIFIFYTAKDFLLRIDNNQFIYIIFFKLNLYTNLL